MKIFGIGGSCSALPQMFSVWQIMFKIVQISHIRYDWKILYLSCCVLSGVAGVIPTKNDIKLELVYLN